MKLHNSYWQSALTSKTLQSWKVTQHLEQKLCNHSLSIETTYYTKPESFPFPWNYEIFPCIVHGRFCQKIKEIILEFDSPFLKITFECVGFFYFFIILPLIKKLPYYVCMKITKEETQDVGTIPGKKIPSRGKPSQENYSFQLYCLRLFILEKYQTFQTMSASKNFNLLSRNFN